LGYPNDRRDCLCCPDGSPEKTYFTYLTNDVLGAWEGGLKITGTGYDGVLLKTWALTVGDAESSYTNHAIPPLHQWQDFYNGGGVNNQVKAGIFGPGVTNGVFSPWMLEYAQYGLGRAVELGFAAKPLQTYTAQYFLNVIAANPDLLEIYAMPVDKANSGGFFTSWTDVLGAFEPAYLTGAGWNASLGPDLLQDFTQGTVPTGRHVWLQPGMAMMVDQGITTWDWWNANVYSKISFATNPAWDIVPRTDNNVLPPQPTATPPGWSTTGATRTSMKAL
jgi:hypothetical protein